MNTVLSKTKKIFNIFKTKSNKENNSPKDILEELFQNNDEYETMLREWQKQ